MGRPQNTIWIDGQPQAADPRRHLLEVALELGLDLPYFCWHPALGCVGACRQCAVTQYRDENDTQGRIVMACMTPCADGSRFSIHAPAAQEMRQGVVEMLMTNHPHDCPVCEEGGNCHLQDVTVMTGQAERRYRHAKRTHRNQDLGPLVAHEMNRCIACYRCVRFYRDYAGGTDLDAFGAHDNVYFGRAQDGTLESPFSGNLVEVCPTGVFTDRPYGEDYTRKWDLQSAPSVCAHCSIGCNTLPGERYGRIKRIENRYHGEINGYFLCDRGRYGHGYAQRADRPREPRWCGETVTRSAAASRLDAVCGSGRVLGIGSPRASLEANFALRQRVGDACFHRGESADEQAATDAALALLRHPAVRIAGVRDAGRSDAAVVLGEDVTQTGARLSLALRQMVRQDSFEQADAMQVPRWQDASVRLIAQETRSPLFVATPAPSDLDALARASLRAAPPALAALAGEIAQRLSSPEGDTLATGIAADIAAALLAAKRPLLVTGCGCRDAGLLRAATRLATAFHAATGRPLDVAVVFPEANSAGAALLGGHALVDALDAMRAGHVQTLVVLENDLFRRVPAAELEPALARVRNLVVLDHVDSPTAQAADLLLPAANVFESDGTLVNFEGRAQRHFAVFRPLEGAPRPAWRWLQHGGSFDGLHQRLAQQLPALAQPDPATPGSDFRIAGTRIPRQPHRYSGRTAMHAARDIHEPRPPQDHASPLAFSMEGAPPTAARPSGLAPVVWAPSWNSGQALHRFQQEIGGDLRGGNPGIRLIVPLDVTDAGNDAEVAGATGRTPRADALVPLHDLFAAEELSALAAVITQRRSGRDTLRVHPDTAARLRLTGAEMARLRIGATTLRLPLHIDAGFARNAIGVPLTLLAGAPLSSDFQLTGDGA
ncbi:NADH-quinone oxidoreductase subunit NuoG [Sinimarinibacterium flocculans]|uniref:NADH-quinone oxidoreductase n=1 Tax=Sinimarinibacterium flocculans TaxID=985250 RepID=A0A318E8S9_9GAMM|nr:NADH-quinone oxidoreductase subunit NuoG [Sinimarinibacterium flocculans]PXV65646.1 NADH dehydrogenase subunit G [Sinimarinibacterium flocculans]